ncbi:MAG: sugar ABC transporter permease [candidate division KSB1 bacterium]|nr:sugar ABC transporter permease [candidate division KSB1 bacterium]
MKWNLFKSSRSRERAAGYLFLAPNFFGFLAFSLLPIAASFLLTFARWDLASPPKFVGLKNYATLLKDELFWKYLWNSVYYTGVTVPLIIISGFFLAYLLNQKIRGVVFFRTIYFLPSVTLIVAVAVIWSWLYNADFGLFNYLLGKIGISGPNWLQSRTWAMPAIIIMGIWKGAGYSMLIFLAGLQSIPQEYYEAAEIDGAGWWQRIRHITIPLISPTTFFILVTATIGAIQGFDQFYVMTRGGPAGATTTLVYYIFQNAFEWFNMGYAATAAAILFIIILIITLIQWRLAKTWVYGFET